MGSVLSGSASVWGRVCVPVSWGWGFLGFSALSPYHCHTRPRVCHWSWERVSWPLPPAVAGGVLCLSPNNCQLPPLCLGYHRDHLCLLLPCPSSFSWAQEAHGEDLQASRAPSCLGRECCSRSFLNAKQKQRQPVITAWCPCRLILWCLSFLSLSTHWIFSWLQVKFSCCCFA